MFSCEICQIFEISIVKNICEQPLLHSFQANVSFCFDAYFNLTLPEKTEIKKYVELFNVYALNIKKPVNWFVLQIDFLVSTWLVCWYDWYVLKLVKKQFLTQKETNIFLLKRLASPRLNFKFLDFNWSKYCQKGISATSLKRDSNTRVFQWNLRNL